jgi:hypothetical protein
MMRFVNLVNPYFFSLTSHLHVLSCEGQNHNKGRRVWQG